MDGRARSDLLPLSVGKVLKQRELQSVRVNIGDVRDLFKRFFPLRVFSQHEIEEEVEEVVIPQFIFTFPISGK